MNEKLAAGLKVLQADSRNAVYRYSNRPHNAAIWAAHVNRYSPENPYPNDDWYGVWGGISEKDFNELLNAGLIRKEESRCKYELECYEAVDAKQVGDDEEWITAAEATRLYNLSESAIRRAINKNIPYATERVGAWARKSGGTWQVRKVYAKARWDKK